MCARAGRALFVCVRARGEQVFVCARGGGAVVGVRACVRACVRAWRVNCLPRSRAPSPALPRSLSRAPSLPRPRSHSLSLAPSPSLPLPRSRSLPSADDAGVPLAHGHAADAQHGGHASAGVAKEPYYEQNSPTMSKRALMRVKEPH